MLRQSLCRNTILWRRLAEKSKSEVVKVTFLFIRNFDIHFRATKISKTKRDYHSRKSSTYPTKRQNSKAISSTTSNGQKVAIWRWFLASVLRTEWLLWERRSLSFSSKKLITLVDIFTETRHSKEWIALYIRGKIAKPDIKLKIIKKNFVKLIIKATVNLTNERPIIFFIECCAEDLRHLEDLPDPGRWTSSNVSEHLERRSGRLCPRDACL